MSLPRTLTALKERAHGHRRSCFKRSGGGRSSSEIAAGLHLSEGTVRNYLSEATAKLNASNRTDAARIARSKGWL